MIKRLGMKKSIIFALLAFLVFFSIPQSSQAAWEGSGYVVLQNETKLKTFDRVDDAIAYAKLWAQSRVYGVSSGELYWDNLPSRVFQYNTYLGDFASRTGAIGYAKQFAHSRVVDANDPSIVYWEWKLLAADYANHLQGAFGDIYGLPLVYQGVDNENGDLLILARLANERRDFLTLLSDKISYPYAMEEWGRDVANDYKALYVNKAISIGIFSDYGKEMSIVVLENGYTSVKLY